MGGVDIEYNGRMDIQCCQHCQQVSFGSVSMVEPDQVDEPHIVDVDSSFPGLCCILLQYFKSVC